MLWIATSRGGSNVVSKLSLIGPTGTVDSPFINSPFAHLFMAILIRTRMMILMIIRVGIQLNIGLASGYNSELGFGSDFWEIAVDPDPIPYYNNHMEPTIRESRMGCDFLRTWIRLFDLTSYLLGIRIQLIVQTFSE